MTAKKLFGLIFALVLVVGSGVVVGLTVVRIQNEKATVSRPKAAEPDFCTNPPSCCQRIANGEGYDGCSWPERAQCNKTQCDGSLDKRGTPYSRCSGKPYPDCKEGNTCQCQCGAAYVGYCNQTSPPPPTQSSFYTATSPKGGEIVSSLTPTFSWTGTMPANNNYKNICIGTLVSPSSCESVGCFSVAGKNSYTHPSPLAANTTYGWTIYSAFSPGTKDVTNMSGGCQQFKTGAGTSCSPGQILCGSTCVNSNTDPLNCGTCANVCAAGKTCASGVCTATAATHLECVDSACKALSGIGNNKDGCTTTGTACTKPCTVDSDCGSGKVCAESACVNPNLSRLGCSNSTCVRKNGAGNNTENCTSVGASCTSTVDEATTCQGNSGSNGKCYDCNGDGVVNILDFSCFRKRWLEKI